MLSAVNLRKVYITKEKQGIFRTWKKEVIAVESLDLEIKPGEIVGLLGINGAGKTTTIKMLSTLLLPTAGSIVIDGIDALKEPMKVKKMVNMIAGGERMLYWRLTARENLSYFGSLYGLNGKALTDRIAFLLKEVELEEAADIPVERYSKGMKQRLQIARGLINDPCYLFLDEPTLGLDAPIAKHLREYIRHLAVQEGKGILLTSHYLSEVEALCNRVYIIDRGALVLHDTPENIIRDVSAGAILSVWVSELQNTMLESLTKVLLPFEASLTVIKQSDGVELRVQSKQDVTALVLQHLFEHGVTLQRLEVEKPKLEDAILTLAGRAVAARETA